MIDTTLDFSCNDDLPSSHNNPVFPDKEEISLQELLEEFNKGDNPDFFQAEIDPNNPDLQQIKMLTRSVTLANGRTSHRKIKMASMMAQNLQADILKATKQLAEDNKSNENIQRQEIFAIPGCSTNHRNLYVNPPSMEGSRMSSQNSIRILIPQEQNKPETPVPFNGRRQVRSQTILAKSGDDAKKVYLPKIGAEGKLLLFKSNTETKVTVPESRVNLISENKSVGFAGSGVDRMFCSQGIGLSKVKSGVDLQEKKILTPKLTSFGSENLIETPSLNKIQSEAPQYLEVPRTYEPKDGKVDLKPGRKIVFRKKSEPQIELIRKESDDC